MSEKSEVVEFLHGFDVLADYTGVPVWELKTAAAWGSFAWDVKIEPFHGGHRFNKAEVDAAISKGEFAKILEFGAYDDLMNIELARVIGTVDTVFAITDYTTGLPMHETLLRILKYSKKSQNSNLDYAEKARRSMLRLAFIYLIFSISDDLTDAERAQALGLYKTDFDKFVSVFLLPRWEYYWGLLSAELNSYQGLFWAAYDDDLGAE